MTTSMQQLCEEHKVVDIFQLTDQREDYSKAKICSLHVHTIAFINVVQGGKERLHSVGGFADEGNQDVPPVPLYSHTHKVGYSMMEN